MKESSLSPATRALLQAAKSDGPRVAARAKMWGAVSAASGLAVAAKGGAAAGSVAAATSSGKLLVAGALFGSALTVGITLAVVRVVSGGSEPAGARVETPSAAMERRSNERHETALAEDPATAADRSDFDSARGEPPPIQLRFSTLGSLHEGLRFEGSEPTGRPNDALRPTRSAPPATSSRVSLSVLPPGGSPGAGVRALAEDSLSQESVLILEARGALRRGDAEAALASLDAARRLGSHSLAPEELSVRARTLRALGRNAEAADAEGLLKTRYPEQKLAR
jgi:hypothetical protein